MIDIRKLKELVRLMVDNDLTELDLKDQQETVAIKRGAPTTVINHQPVIYNGTVPAAGAHAAPPRPAPAHDTAEAAEAPNGGGDNGAAPAAASDSGLVAVQSPMVGTFYPSPSPDAAPFVTVGQTVSPETTVCLSEAMKVFNEIKAEASGVVERVLVNSGEAVEFGQKLILLRPA